MHFDGRPAPVPDHDIRNIERFVEALAATGREVPRVPVQASGAGFALDVPSRSSMVIG